MRRGPLILIGGAMAAILFVQNCVRFYPAERSEPPEARKADGSLVVPVARIDRSQLVDTFTQSREGGRPHDAIDIAAPRGTPVVAAAPGVIEKLFESERGGKTVYIRSLNRRWIHYYAHLDRYRDGLRETQAVDAGEMIGTVGASGNADPRAPHLHFAIHKMEPGEPWYEGTPVNPFPLLTEPR